MPASDLSVPEQLPVLSRGKHRNPRKGACLMELVSYLAGERWSDHPACTHPLLAALARHVNDHTSDDARPRLAVLIPSLIGLTSDDPRVDVRIALRCARAALPVAAADRQLAMAVAVLASERVLDDLDGRAPGSLEETSRSALDQVPQAAIWAREFSSDHRVTVDGFRRHAATNIVSTAVQGIAQACVTDPDELLHDLLAEAVDDCTAWVARDTDAAARVDASTWRDVCHLTGATTRG